MRADKFPEIIREQLSRYPLMEVRDLYKLVYQGVMGSGHAISSEEKARGWMREETFSLERPSAEEPMWETVSADGEIIRVNLRPFVASGGDTDALLTVFIRTGREFRGSPEELEETWKRACSLQDRFDPDMLTDFLNEQRSASWPPIHHSETYRAIYRPAYRVALKRLCLEKGLIP